MFHALRHALLIIGLLISSSAIAEQPSEDTASIAASSDPAQTATDVDAPAENNATDDLAAESVPVETDPTPATVTAAPGSPHDLSVMGMYNQADWVVKAVMIGLVIASLVTWTVFLAKSLELGGLKRKQARTLNTVMGVRTLKEAREALANAKDADLLRAAEHEIALSCDALTDSEGVKERVASRLERMSAAKGRIANRGTSVLATIGSTAPFVGLFGTVWGIMNSFIGIAESNTTNLAVVAPGIAEALLATALGLVAAIPAVMIYNHFTRQISAYKALVGDSAAAVLRLISRDLSRNASQS